MSNIIQSNARCPVCGGRAWMGHSIVGDEVIDHSPPDPPLVDISNDERLAGLRESWHFDECIWCGTVVS